MSAHERVEDVDSREESEDFGCFSCQYERRSASSRSVFHISILVIEWMINWI